MSHLIASGLLYKKGDRVGIVGNCIDSDSIDKIIESSPDKIPVLTTYSMDANPENVLGNATLSRVDDGIKCDITFNVRSSQVYGEIFNDSEKRNHLKLGFMIKHKNLLQIEPKITSGSIICITIASDNLGGKLDDIRWEELD